MKRWLSVVLALLLVVSMTVLAEGDPSGTYNAYYVVYDEGSVREYARAEYAESDGVLLYMYYDGTEVNVSMPMRSDAATVDDLAEMQLKQVESYGEVVGESSVEDWYAPWDAVRPGRKLTYSFSYGMGENDMVFDVVKYMAVLNDDKYVMVELLDQSGDVQGAAARLEGGFLPSLQVLSFPVDGGGSAYLTGAEEREGKVYLTLQPYDVVLDENTLQHHVRLQGDAQVVPLSAEACVMAPQGEDTGMLKRVENSAAAIRSFMEEYRSLNGEDCVFNLLLSGGEVRWMTYSYLY